MRRMGVLWLVVLLGWGCAEADAPVTPEENNETNNQDACVDNDNDGFVGRSGTCPNGTDCDDSNPNISPTKQDIPGNGVDEDCSGADTPLVVDCQDGDNDGFKDEACGGTDCNDSDPTIRPRGTEICGNTIDEDCDGMDLECAAGCMDADNDGYGVLGSIGCPRGNEIDCDDSDPAVNPGAAEVCNGKDDNCIDGADECGLEGQVCVDGQCQGGAGAQCENKDDCAGSLLTCDFTVDPKICKVAENGTCAQASDCVSGLACEDNKCTGNYCALNTCTGDYPFCNREGGHCSECPFWDAANADASCTSSFEQCAPGGWCAENWDIEDAAPIQGTATTEDIYWVSIALAWCWLEKRPAGNKDMCYAMWIFNAVGRTITEAMVEDAYLDGNLDGLLDEEEDDALNDIWGPGLFNAKEIDWKQDMLPGTAKDVCLWYQPGNLFSRERLVVDYCINFTP